MKLSLREYENTLGVMLLTTFSIQKDFLQFLMTPSNVFGIAFLVQ